LLVHPSAALAISDHAGKALAAVAAATVLDLANRWNVINTPCPSPQVRAASSPLQPSQQGPPSRTHRQQAAEARARFGSSLRAEDLYEARRFLQLSLSVDPNYARAYAMLTDTFATAWANALDSDFLNPAALDQAHLFASKAVQLDPNLPEGRAALGGVLAWKRQHEASLVEIDKPLTLLAQKLDTARSQGMTDTDIHLLLQDAASRLCYRGKDVPPLNLQDIPPGKCLSKLLAKVILLLGDEHGIQMPEYPAMKRRAEEAKAKRKSALLTKPNTNPYAEGRGKRDPAAWSRAEDDTLP